MINWTHVRFFKQDEFDDPLELGSGKYIDGALLFKLDRLRDVSGYPVIVHKSVGGAVDLHGSHGHSKNSYHLLKMGCRAVDFHFAVDRPARIQIFHVLQSGFSGIGIYYDWRWGDRPLPVGFHVDTRPLENTQLWKRIGGRYTYIIE